MVVLPDCDPDGAVTIAEQMRQSIETLKIPHKYSFVADHVTVSIGVKSIHYESDMTFNEIVEKVDQMLYLAKDQGRNRVMA